MAGAKKGFLVALLVSLVAVATNDAVAARTSYDANGTFVIDGAKVFPIVLSLGPPLGGTTPSGIDGLDEVTAAGVNVLRGGPQGVPFTDAMLAEAEAMNEAAAARGVYTWVNLRELVRAQPGTAEEAMLKTVVTTLADDPALAFWRGADEPFWAGLPVSSLTYAYCLTTSRGDASWCDQTLSLDPWHLWVTVQAPRGTPAELAPYSAVTDSHGVDVYPVGIKVRAPALHDVGRWTKTIESITPNRVVWTTLQVCFSGSSDGTGNYVLPTKQQERYMIYDAIINGARALNFFGGGNRPCFNSTDAAYGWNWTFWNDVLKSLVLEVGPKSELYPALLEPGTALPLTSSDPTTEVTSRRVGDELWVIAARHGAGTATVEIGGVPLDGVTGGVYTEGRSIAVIGGAITDTFSQWGVHVYRFPLRPSSGNGGPDTWISSGPAGTVRDRGAVFSFGSTSARRFECALDGGPFAPCSSPTAVSELADGAHRFLVRAVDVSGRVDGTPALRAWTVDTAAPTVPVVSALPRFQRRTNFAVGWAAVDQGSGVASYDVRYREGAWNGGVFGSLVSWKSATAATAARFRGQPGSTYCFSIRAQDGVGNASRWSRERCTAVPLDDRALAASGRWTRKSGSGYYLATYSASSTRRAALVAKGVRAKRLAVLVARCPLCGTARVFWNGALIREIPLVAARSRPSELIPVASFPEIRAGKLVVRITSTGKRVHVDGVGASLR